MSRIGRLPIPIPSGVDIAIDGQAVSVKGPKGALSHVVAEPIGRNDPYDARADHARHLARHAGHGDFAATWPAPASGLPMAA